MALRSVSSSSVEPKGGSTVTARWTEREQRSMATNRYRLRRSRSLVCSLGRCLMSMWSGDVRERKRREAELVVAEGTLAFGGPLGEGLRPAVQAFGLEDAPDAVAVEVRQEVAHDEGKIIEWEVGAAPEGADDGAPQRRMRYASVSFQGS